MFLNEAYFDKNGGSNNFIELAHPNTTSLATYTIELFEDIGGLVSLYHELTYRQGSSGQERNGLSFYSWTLSMRNNAPDAIAIVDDLGNLLEFISFGPIGEVAIGGAASGSVSRSVGVQHRKPSEVSISRQGNGCISSDVIWA